MRIAEASKEVKEESNNKSAAFKLYLCRWSGASIIHHQAADVTLCFLRNRRHWLGFHSEGMGDRQTVRQTPLMTVLWSHCRSSPPSQTEANLQQAQAQSVHCQDPQRTRSLPRCTAEPGDRHSLLPGPPSVSHLFSLPSVSLLPLTVPVLFVFKNAPAGLNAAN